MATSAPAPDETGRTAWSRNMAPPLRRFLRTETGGASVLLAATVAALVWANVDAHSYEKVWGTVLTIRLGGHQVSEDLQGWINSGLMTFFFFVVGLEARREFDLGELRERRRVTLPLLAGIGGMAVPVLLYSVIVAGHAGAHGWGVAMSTDTAFALGALALVGPRFSDRLRAFLLTVAVADDLVALIVIATVYTQHVAVGALLLAVGFFAVIAVAARVGVGAGLFYFVLGTAAWVALHASGIDPVVVGLGMGLLTYARPPSREDLERASDLFRLFREQPTSELAATARAGLESAISPNERLQRRWHPWTSYAIVPVFALANAGIAIDGGFLSRAYSSPITIGIIVGYVVGKPLGIMGTAWLVRRLSLGRLRPSVGWVAVGGGGALAGIGFTVALLIASLAFSGDQLKEAKLGILTAAVAAALVGTIVFRVTARLSPLRRARALLGDTEPLIDLAEPVDPERDHIRGPVDAPVTLLEYGDFECPYCGLAEPVVREVLSGFGGDVRYVWRHLPLNDVHSHAQIAAEASEAAADQGRFWEMHDRLLTHQGELRTPELVQHAQEVGLDLDRFRHDLRHHVGAGHVADDVESADLSGVSGTPTFFVNGRRLHGAYDIESLTAAVKAAGARARVAAGG